MSSYHESYKAALSEGRDKASVSPEFHQAFPTLAKIFEGVAGDGNGTYGVPPATLNLFWEGGVLKFCIMPRYGNRIAFGTVSQAVKGFAGIEQALVSGHFEWRIAKSRKSS